MKVSIYSYNNFLGRPSDIESM